MEGVPGEWLELTAAERVTGRRMLESARTAPQFSLELGADMTGALALLETGPDQAPAEVEDRPSITAILVKAVADALRDHPRANASFEDGRVKLYGHINIGVAVGGDAGLLVPVIKDADRKSLAQVAREIRAFQDKARQMRFGADDLEGGTFTISNLGMHGIERFNAIINPPQSAILAVGRVVKTPVGLEDGTVALRPMMSLALTVDHRAMDGIQGARFLVAIKARLEEPLFSP
jgi:pyruvate dehydrogenase E2 component (dihydrolipoamide acetyltransferase)